MRHPLPASSTWWRAGVFATIGGIVLAVAQPAFADHDNGRHRGHYKHRHPPAYYYHPAPPPVVYYEPRRVYVPPPPVYYAPPPGVSLNLTVPLR